MGYALDKLRVLLVDQNTHIRQLLRTILQTVGTGTIDLYKPTFSAMNRWGVRHVDIEVVKWGSFDKSLKVLKPRTKWSHIRRMVKSILRNGASEEARLTAVILSHHRD